MKSRLNNYDFLENFADRFCDRQLLLVRPCFARRASRRNPMHAAAPQPAQKQFDTPKQAADALIQVAATFDVAAAKEILGPDGEDIISFRRSGSGQESGGRVCSQGKRKECPSRSDKKNPNQAILLVGNDDFPLPIPIVKQKGKWFFDTKVGREEILNRRIGANELNAIEICRGFVEAQHEYAVEKHDGSKVNQYAQRIISTPGKHDGLAWQNADGTWGGPVGEEVAKALEQGYTERVQPYHGYYFKVLKGQGPAAPMGEMDFVVGGAMIGGFALAAAPAEYRVTGVHDIHCWPRRGRLRKGSRTRYAEDVPEHGQVQPGQDLESDRGRCRR